MSRLAYVGDLYAVSGAIGGATSVVDLFAIADPAGASLDRAVRELSRDVQEGTIELLGELLTVARRLRWRISVEPFPSAHGLGRAELLADLKNVASQCRVMVGSDTRWILDELVRSADAVNSQAIRPLGEFLLQSLREAGGAGCVLVLSGSRAAAGARSWLSELEVAVPVVSDRERAGLEIHDKAYLVGAPPLFGPAVFGAPRAQGLAYLFPSWIQDRALPTADFSTYAEGSIKPRTCLHRIGQEAFIPERLRNVLLSGGLSIMLDLEGDWIRTLDPDQPAGQRVRMRDVATVDPGTFLVLREGQSESAPLYLRALTRLAAQAESVQKSQSRWKEALRQQLQSRGAVAVVQQLRGLGVKAAAQASAWTAETLARPQSDADFAILLRWLGLPAEPYGQNASLLRRARSQAMADVREALEEALGDADMPGLERVGFLRLDLELEGFAGIIASRVLAISPYLDVVPRSELRIPKEDASARWLE